MTEIITLSELTFSVRSAIVSRFPESLWVVAEISELNENKTGHCYLELIEKGLDGIKIIARIRGVIWAHTYRNIKSFFRNATGYALGAGIKVLLLVQLEFHEVYGLNLNIRDIDPSYTLGEIAKRKQEVIRRLKEEGVIEMNKKIDFPLVPQRIAVVSSETAAGYGDFMDSLHYNSYGFTFHTTLFPALMQGEKSEPSLIEALERIFEDEDKYDVVAIIRGGGAQSELDTFNGYELAYHICQFPLPVITGIGHERDETVADFVANKSLKTPTAVAEFIISRALSFKDKIENYMMKVTSGAIAILSENMFILENKTVRLDLILHNKFEVQSNKIKNLDHSLSKVCSQYLANKRGGITRILELIKIRAWNRVKECRYAIDGYSINMIKFSNNFLERQYNYINHIEKNLDYLNPYKILDRGYTITSSNGKIVKSSSILAKGDMIETTFRDGKVSSKIEVLSKSNTIT